jgi:hypothetical protein
MWLAIVGINVPSRRRVPLHMALRTPTESLCRTDDALTWTVTSSRSRPCSGPRFMIRHIDPKDTGSREKNRPRRALAGDCSYTERTLRTSSSIMAEGFAACRSLCAQNRSIHRLVPVDTTCAEDFPIATIREIAGYRPSYMHRRNRRMGTRAVSLNNEQFANILSTMSICLQASACS